MTTLQRRYTECRHGQLHLVHGRPAAAAIRPPLVLFHQNPSTSEEYHHLLAAMGRDRHVYAFDTPGYGMSDRPPAPLSIADYVAAMIDGIEALGLADDRPVDLFGFHTGTFLAIEAALQLGSRCGRLTLAGIPFRTPAERQERLDQIHAVAPPTDDGDAIFDRLRWLWRFLVAGRADGVPIERAAEIFVERAKPLHRYWWAYEGVWTYPIERRLRAVTHPTLVLLPDEMFHEHSIAASALIRDCRLLEMPGLHRDIFEPEGGCAAVADALRAFLV